MKIKDEKMFQRMEHMHIADKLREVHATYQENNSIQNVHTPKTLADDIINRIGLDQFEGKDVLVIANYDVVKLLAWMKGHKKSINFKSLTFLTDIDPNLLPQKDRDLSMYNTVVADLSSPDTIDMMGKKYDIVIGNPPYNDDSTTGNDGSRRGFAGGLFVKFIDMSVHWANKGGWVSIVAPSRRFLAGKFRESNLCKYMKKGLMSITSADSFFDIDIDGICVYMFKAGVPQIALTDDCLKPTYDTPRENLSKYHHRSKSAPRRVINELEKSDTGSVVYCTTSVIVRVTDPSRVEDRHADSWRVIYNANGATDSIGKVLVAKPGEYVSGSVNYMVVNSAEEANLICETLNSERTKEIQSSVRVSCANSAYHMSFIEDPLLTLT